MEKRVSKRKRLSKFVVCFFIGTVFGCNAPAPQKDASVVPDAGLTTVESSKAAFWLGQEQPLRWTCADVSSNECLDAFVQQWWSHAQLLMPQAVVNSVRVKVWFFEGDRAWIDLDSLPAVALEVEARWLLSLFTGLNQWLGKDWRWTVLENGQPRQSFSGSIVLPSVMDRDFMENVMTLVENNQVKP